MINNKNYTRDQLKEILEDELFQNLLFHTANRNCYYKLNKACLKSKLTDQDFERIDRGIRFIGSGNLKPSEYFTLIALYYLKDEIDKSIENLEKFLEVYDKPIENNLKGILTEYAFKAADKINYFEEEGNIYYKGEYLVQIEHCQEAIPVLENLLEKSNDEKKPRLLYLLAMCYFQINQIDKFMELFNKSLLLYPNEHNIYHILGMYYYSIEDYEKAIESYNLVKDYFYKHLPEAKDNKSTTYNYKGLIGSYLKTGKIYKIINEIDERLSINPDNEVLLSYYAICHQEDKNYDKAFEIINKALSIEPYSGISLSVLAKNYYFKESYNKAIYYFKECIRVHYKDLDSYQNLGLTYIKIKEFENAIKIFKFILCIWSKSGFSYFALSKIYKHLGQNDLASDFFEKAEKFKPFYIDEYKKIDFE